MSTRPVRYTLVTGIVVSAGMDIMIANALGEIALDAGGNVIATDGIDVKTVNATGDIRATSLSAETVFAGGNISAPKISATSVTAWNSVEANSSLSAKNLSAGELHAGGSVNIDNVLVSGLAELGNASGKIERVSAGTFLVTGSGTEVTAGTVETADGTLIRDGGRLTVTDVLKGSINISGCGVAANTVSLGPGESIDVILGSMTIGSTDMTGINNAMSSAGKPAGLALENRVNIVNGGRIVVGTPSGTVTSGGAAFGSDAVLAVNAAVAAQAPNSAMLKAKNVSIDKGSTLFISGASSGQRVFVYEATEGGSGSFSNVITNNMLLMARLATPDNIGMYYIAESYAKDIMPNLDSELADFLDYALRNGYIGDDERFTYSPNGGTRFLSRIISRDFGGKDPALAATTYEGAARIIAVAGIPQMSLTASMAVSNALAGRLGMLAGKGGSHGSGSSDDIDNILGKKSGYDSDSGNDRDDDNDGKNSESEGKKKKRGISLWAMPLAQKTNAKYEAGNYSTGLDATIAGIAVGGDAEIVNGLHAGLMFSLGTGRSESFGDFNSTQTGMDFWGVGAYALWMRKNFSLSADFQYLSMRNSTEQEMPEMMQMENLEMEANSYVLSAGLMASYRFNTKIVDITPYVGLRFMHVHPDEFMVRSGDLDVIRARASDHDIFSIPFGVTFEKRIRFDNGWTLSPHANVHVTPYFGDLDSTTEAEFIGVPGSVTTKMKVLDDITFGGSIGFEASKGSMTLGADYSLEIGRIGTNHSISAQFLYEF